jgi:oligopeptide transport system substrate-binding protein
MTAGLRTTLTGIATLVALTGCTNNPYRPGESSEATYFTSYSTPPAKLDPANAYYSHEGAIIDQIYEPPFSYHYLKRPYTLIPLTATQVPEPVYFDKDGNRIEEEDPLPERVARAEYTIRIKPGIRYQDHPCFAQDASGAFVYGDVALEDIKAFDYPSQFPHQGTREVRADDYALQIRRMADPRTECPIYSTVKSYILGMEELHEAYKTALKAERTRRGESAGGQYSQERSERKNPIRLDYMAADFGGVQVIDELTYKIVLKRKYPQILYWMCMHFFAPVPQEALDFYAQPAMVEKQFTMRRCPVGSGPYFLESYRPNEMIVLRRNPNYHTDTYPTEGMPGDEEAGLLVDAGKQLPFIERQVLRIEKEAIPSWSKFLQGYYDDSGISSDVFDQAIQIVGTQDPTLSDAMMAKGIRLITDVEASFWYTKFNMLDDLVGGYTDERRALRQAISIVLDVNEYLDIFANGRGVASAGPVPPGIFGYRGGADGVNPHVDEWDPVLNRSRRQPLERARELMKKAGFPGGRTPDGSPLTLYLDHASSGDPTFRSRLEWMQRKLDQIGVRIKERATELSRFREKLLQGNWQISGGGWLADYPDPENFLFLFYGPNSKAKHSGSNATNYESTEFDRLFLQMETMANGPKRQELIDKAMAVLQNDAPAVWDFHPVGYSLQHEWYRNVKPHQMLRKAAMKYRRIEPGLRVQRQEEWNDPVVWPVALLIALAAAAIIPAAVRAYRRERGL